MVVNFILKKLIYTLDRQIKEGKKMTKAIFQLEPLTCPSCVKKIETALTKTEGVTEARVLFNSGKVKTEFNEAVIEAEGLRTIIQKLGYPVTKTKVS